MTDYTDFKTTVRDWVGLQSVTDAVIDSWIRMLELRINREMRVGEMIVRDTTTLTASEAPLPEDWIATEYLKYVPGSGIPDIRYGHPIRYKTLDAFYEASNDPNHCDYLKSFFTHIGLAILINPNVGPTDGTQIEIGYYSKVPSLATDGSNWLIQSYYDILLYGVLAHASSKLVEDDRVPIWEARATKGIADANDAWQRAKAGGGPLVPRFKSFG